MTSRSRSPRLRSSISCDDLNPQKRNGGRITEERKSVSRCSQSLDRHVAGPPCGVDQVYRSRAASARPAPHPLDHAHWKLSPPMRPSTSSTSPTIWRPGQMRDCIVEGSISLSETPPAVASAYVYPLEPMTGSGHSAS